VLKKKLATGFFGKVRILNLVAQIVAVRAGGLNPAHFSGALLSAPPEMRPVFILPEAMVGRVGIGEGGGGGQRE
jgi:hypothetical protein